MPLPVPAVSAAIGGRHDGKNALAGQLEDSPGPGMLNLAGRGFFSMDRFLRFRARVAEVVAGSRRHRRNPGRAKLLS